MKLLTRSGIGVLALCCAILAAGQTPLQPAQIGTPLRVVVSGPADVSEAASGPMPRTSIAAPEEGRHDTFINRLWIASLFAAGAGTSLDAASSWGKREGNPLLASSNGAFGAKGLGIKMSVAAAVLIPQICLRKHKEMKGIFATGNFAEAAIFSGAAVHNLQIRSAATIQ